MLLNFFFFTYLAFFLWFLGPLVFFFFHINLHIINGNPKLSCLLFLAQYGDVGERDLGSPYVVVGNKQCVLVLGA